MKCKGKFRYKCLNHIDAGEFVNDKGQAIPYKGSYKLKVDEITDNGVVERIFKVAEDNVQFVQACSVLDLYTEILIEFDVLIFGSGVRLVPTQFNLA